MFTDRNRPENMVDMMFELKTQQLLDRRWRTLDEPAHFLVRARRRFEWLTQALAKRRAAAAEDRRVLDIGWRAIYAQGVRMRGEFKIYDRFVRENEGKRERARDSIVEQMALAERRAGECDALHAHIARMRALKQQFDGEIRAHRLYELFLERVVEASNSEFTNTNAILQKYDLMAHYRNVLAAQHVQMCAEMDEIKAKLDANMEKWTIQILTLQQRWNWLQEEYYRAKANCHKMENLLNDIANRIAKGLDDVRSVRISINNNYQLICVKKGVPGDKKASLEDKCIVIKRTMAINRAIIQKLKSGNPSGKVTVNIV